MNEEKYVHTNTYGIAPTEYVMMHFVKVIGSPFDFINDTRRFERRFFMVIPKLDSIINTYEPEEIHDFCMQLIACINTEDNENFIFIS